MVFVVFQCRTCASTEERVLTLRVGTGVIVPLVLQGTGARTTSRSVTPILVRIMELALMTLPSLCVSVWLVCIYKWKQHSLSR